MLPLLSLHPSYFSSFFQKFYDVIFIFLFNNLLIRVSFSCCCCFFFSLYISILQIFWCSLFLWFSTHLISAVHCFSFARVLVIFRKSLCDKGLLNACKLLIEVKTLNGFLVDFFSEKTFWFCGYFSKEILC